MPPYRKTFSRSDAWIFAALKGGACQAREGATLDSIIMSADMLNHAIPRADEMAGALEKLHAHGLVKIRGPVVHLTPHGESVYENGYARRGGLFSIVDNMQKALNSPRIKHPSVEREAEVAFVTPTAISKAYENYRRMCDDND